MPERSSVSAKLETPTLELTDEARHLALLRKARRKNLASEDSLVTDNKRCTAWEPFNDSGI